MLLADVELRTGETALRTEYFAPVLAVVETARAGQAFLNEAIRTANEELAGTLGVNADRASRGRCGRPGRPSTRRSPKLRYGAIAVNAWTAFGFLTAPRTWGAFPGHTLDDVGVGDRRGAQRAAAATRRSAPSSAGRSGPPIGRSAPASSR